MPVGVGGASPVADGQAAHAASVQSSGEGCRLVTPPPGREKGWLPLIPNHASPAPNAPLAEAATRSSHSHEWGWFFMHSRQHVSHARPGRNSPGQGGRPHLYLNSRPPKGP
eukprot:scaffold16045_cov110-Isochrysis_galbana.AAC.11